MKINSTPRRRERRKKAIAFVSLPIIAAGTILSIEAGSLFRSSNEISNECKGYQTTVQEIDNVFSGSMEGVMESHFSGRVAEDISIDTTSKISSFNDFKRYFYKRGSWDVSLIEKYFSLENLDEFKYPDEIGIIIYTATRLNVDPSLLLAIRQSEGGGCGREFGILPGAMPDEMRRKYYNDSGIEENGVQREYISRFPGDTLEKQATWTAWTIKKNTERYIEAGKNPNDIKEFISFLADRYAPPGAENDPDKLNQYWEENVTRLLRQYSVDY